MPRGGNRRQKPAKLKALEGNRQKIAREALEARIEAEPQGRGKPKLPTHLSAAERKIFAAVLDSAPAGILTGADQRLLESYAVAVAAADAAAVKLAATGQLVKGKDGAPMINPLWRVWRQAAHEARLIGSELGLSPASRAKLANGSDPEPDPLEMLLGGQEGNGAWTN